jgi:hypothetical protein
MSEHYVSTARNLKLVRALLSCIEIPNDACLARLTAFPSGRGLALPPADDAQRPPRAALGLLIEHSPRPARNPLSRLCAGLDNPDSVLI